MAEQSRFTIHFDGEVDGLQKAAAAGRAVLDQLKNAGTDGAAAIGVAFNQSLQGVQAMGREARKTAVQFAELAEAQAKAKASAEADGKSADQITAINAAIARQHQAMNALADAKARVAKGDHAAAAAVTHYATAVQKANIEVQGLTTKAAGFSGAMGQMSMQATMAVDDFMTMYQVTGKLSDGLRGAGNNITAMMMPLGTLPTMLAVFGTSAAYAFAKYIEGSKEAEERTKGNIERMQELLKLSKEEGMTIRQRNMLGDIGAINEMKAAIDAAASKKENAFTVQEIQATQGDEGVKRYRERVRQSLRGEAGAGKVAVGKEAMDFSEAERRLREMERQSKIEQAKALADEFKMQLGGRDGDFSKFLRGAVAGGASLDAAQQQLAGQIGGMPMDQRFRDAGVAGRLAQEARDKFERELRGEQLASRFDGPAQQRKAAIDAAEDRAKDAQKELSRIRDEANNVNTPGRLTANEKEAIAAQESAVKGLQDAAQALKDAAEAIRQREEQAVRVAPLGAVEVPRPRP